MRWFRHFDGRDLLSAVVVLSIIGLMLYVSGLGSRSPGANLPELVLAELDGAAQARVTATASITSQTTPSQSSQPLRATSRPATAMSSVPAAVATSQAVGAPDRTQSLAAPTAAPAVTSAASLPAPTATVETLLNAVPPSAAEVVRKIASAEAGLRTGQLAARIDVADASSTTVDMAFDLGDGRQPPRLESMTTYLAGGGTRAVERITVGDRTWQREPGGEWLVVSAETGIRARVQPYLPAVDAVSDPVLEGSPERTLIHWHDSTHGSEVTLRVDPSTGIALELQEAASGGPTLTVTYSGWNDPVRIAPPTMG